MPLQIGANNNAVGTGAVANRAGQVALGNSANTYMLAEIGSTASNAAQNGTLRLLTTDAAGNLSTAALDIATRDRRPRGCRLRLRTGNIRTPAPPESELAVWRQAAIYC